MELCSMLCGSLDRREFGGEWIHVYIQLSFLPVHLKLPQHFQSAIPQYKIKSLKFGKNLQQQSEHTIRKNPEHSGSTFHCGFTHLYPPPGCAGQSLNGDSSTLSYLP